MNANWEPLERELEIWHRQDLVLPLWWRDDDATSPTPALSRLHQLSVAMSLPVHLAVIPRDADAALAEMVADTTGLIPVVHGWAHRNHAPEGTKKAEFGQGRPLPESVADARRALDRLVALFDGHLRTMFVPPWNRIDPDIVAELAGLGYTALSTFTPRANQHAAPGLLQINTHIDPIDWRGTRGLADPGRLVELTARRLAARRAGHEDNREPLGILTHHLVHTEEVWTFCEQLLTRLLQGPATAWQFDGTPTFKEPER